MQQKSLPPTKHRSRGQVGGSWKLQGHGVQLGYQVGVIVDIKEGAI